MRKRWLAISLLGLVMSVLPAGQAFAHVTVKPAEVLTGAFQTFTVGVPNEKDSDVTLVTVNIPAGLEFVTPTLKPGWTITTEKTGEGEAAVVKSISWMGSLPAGFRDEFTFSAKTSASPGTLEWRAYQTYADGVKVSWDQPPGDDAKDDDSATSGPFSVTRVTVQSPQAVQAAEADQQLATVKRSAQRAWIVGIISVIISLSVVYYVTRVRSDPPAK